MKRALRAILIAGRKMEEDVRYNKKKITIREGHRDYNEGHVLIGCDKLDWCVMRTIISVRHTTISEITKEECKDDGFYDHTQLIETLKGFYPNINWNSPVTVIRWE